MREHSIKKDYSRSIPWYVWAVLGLVLLATAIYPLVPTVHADTKRVVTPALYDKSDKEQDTEFCKQITNGVPVHGANVSQIELYCMTHGL